MTSRIMAATIDLLIYLVLVPGLIEAADRPHILFIVADDLGWNDVGFRNPTMKTPTIDKLVREGVLLNQSYVQPMCSPSRSAFMSGYYPFRMGLQHEVIYNWQAVCLPLSISILPQHLKQLGYSTHLVGKWHLGFCSWNCTPTYRGFDSFYGFYGGAADQYTHKANSGLDLWDNVTPDRGQSGRYSASLFQDKAVEVIEKHDVSCPLFLYLPFQSVHDPLKVPLEYEQLYPHIKNENRRKYAGMITMMDDVISNVTKALKAKNMFDDTLIIFTSDNGGWLTKAGNNWPLRAGKVSLYEGGTRVIAFVYGSGLKKTGYTFEGLVHAVDWLPTIIAAAGGELPSGERDGLNLWPAISQGENSPRNEFIYNIDDHPHPTTGHMAIRSGDYKLMVGSPGRFTGWFRLSRDGKNIRFHDTEMKKMTIWKKANQVQLFNLKDDPTERNEISDQHPEIVARLRERLEVYHKDAVKAKFPGGRSKSNPKYYQYVWMPGWCEPSEVL